MAEESCEKEARKFSNLRNSPLHRIIWAIDGIAMSVQQPRTGDVPDPRKYLNRKRCFPVVVQTVVSADYKFLYVDAAHAGSTHDSTSLQGCSL